MRRWRSPGVSGARSRVFAPRPDDRKSRGDRPRSGQRPARRGDGRDRRAAPSGQALDPDLRERNVPPAVAAAGGLHRHGQPERIRHGSEERDRDPRRDGHGVLPARGDRERGGDRLGSRAARRLDVDDDGVELPREGHRDSLPIGRNYADVVFAQPGAQADFGETQGRSLPISIYGATSAENLYLIDGINTTNVVKGIEGKDINNEFVEEVEVKTDGYQAEYGRNTGGVINVITKSGGNEFHGGAFAYYNDTGMRAEPENGNPQSYDTPAVLGDRRLLVLQLHLSKDVRQEYGVNLGGYLWKDKIWFFAAYDRVRHQPDRPGPRPELRGHVRARVPERVRSEQVGGQAHAESVREHDARGQLLLRPADAAGCHPSAAADVPRPAKLRRPPGHRRSGLRRAVEPDPGLPRPFLIAICEAQRPVRHDPDRCDLGGHSRLHSVRRSGGGQPRGVRLRLRADPQQPLDPGKLRGRLHGLPGEHGGQARGRLREGLDRRPDVLHRTPAAAHPSLPPGGGGHELLRSLEGADLRQRPAPASPGRIGESRLLRGARLLPA